MMTSSMASQGVSSSSSFSTRRWTYDVFLSFRGKDTRDNFTAHLYDAWRRKGINTSIDDDELKRGDEISPALLKAIEESRISIVIFSQNYASSKWCMDELLKIIETKGQRILPVFYKVDPSDVRHQKNSYKDALAKHALAKHDMKVQSWKTTLTQVANLSGWHSKNYINEAKFIEEIVHYVSRIVNHTFFHVAKHPVGIESRVRKINSLLSIDQMDDRRMIGILGAAGIGKTTIAKAIYNSMAYWFEGSCFLANVRGTCLVKLQNKLLSKILEHIVEVDHVDEGSTLIKKRLCSKRILLILDDVDQLLQLDKLVGEVDWFGLGSRIIITTCNNKVLIDHRVVDQIYKVEELNGNEACELFCWNAFKKDWNAFKESNPHDDFLKLVEDAISYVGGLPLALEVLGSYLHDTNICQWESALNKYKSIPHENILERLRISYDGLHPNDKNIFLDIASFFKGRWTEDNIKMLDSPSYSSIDGINVLIARSLVTIDENKMLEMHNLLRDMGREVVRQESPNDPSQRSRLWFHEDVREVLEDDKGTNKIQGILVDLPEGEDMVCLSSEAFKNMKSLRLLMVTPNSRFSTVPNFLPNKLRVFDWSNYPSESLPSNFCGRNLIVLRMRGSPLKELKGIKNFQEMKIMDFLDCEFLKTTPDVSSIPNLEELIFDMCMNLVEIHHSVGRHDKLVRLSVKECNNLSNFPRSIRMRSLKDLNVNGCSSLGNFPVIECEMKSLTSIKFGGTGIKELPPSIRYLIGLQILSLDGCINLTNLPSSIYELQHLEYLLLSGCSNLVSFPRYDDFPSMVFPKLRDLYLDKCVRLESGYVLSILNCYSTLEKLDISRSGIFVIPKCIKRFVALWEFKFHGCKKLLQIQAFPPKLLAYPNDDVVDARGCTSLELYGRCWLPELPVPVGAIERLMIPLRVGSGIKLTPSIQGPQDNREFSILISGEKIPNWFDCRKEVSNSNSCEIEVDVPARFVGEISRIVFSAVIETGDSKILSIIMVSVISGGVVIYSGNELFPIWHSKCVWLRSYVLEPCKLKLFNGHLRVKFVHEDLKAMKSCGVHLLRRCEEKAKDLIGGIHEVTKRPRDDDDDDDEKFESNCYPQQKRHSSTSGIRISDTEAEAF